VVFGLEHRQLANNLRDPVEPDQLSEFDGNGKRLAVA